MIQVSINEVTQSKYQISYPQENDQIIYPSLSTLHLLISPICPAWPILIYPTHLPQSSFISVCLAKSLSSLPSLLVINPLDHPILYDILICLPSLSSIPPFIINITTPFQNTPFNYHQWHKNLQLQICSNHFRNFRHPSQHPTGSPYL